MRGILMTMLGIVMMYSTMAQQIVGVEYYLDSDPGVGQGTYVSATSSGADVTFDLDLNVNTLSLGYHNLGVRVKDDNGNYSLGETRRLYVMELTTPTASSLVGGYEYFIDSDPGLGNGTFTALSGADSQNTTIAIPISGLSAGYHYLGVRFKDVADNWSTNEFRKFYIIPSPSTLPSAKISKIEYFFDTDPGVGNGIVAASNLSADEIDETFAINLTGKAVGDYTINVRVIDSQGVGSIYYQGSFEIRGLSNDATLSSITLSEGSLNPLFDPATLSYDVVLPQGTTTVDLGASATDSNAGVSGVGSIDVSSGSAIAEILVTAEDETTTQTYTINFSKEAVDIQDGLVAYYPFSGNANDGSGNDNHGIVNGATLATDRAGNENSAYSFNGSNNWINCGNSSVLNSTNLTISVWYKANTLNNANMVISRYQNFHEHVYSGEIAGRYYTSSQVQFNSPIASPLGEWVHFIWVIGDDKVNTYKNGGLVSTFSKTGTLSYNPDNDLVIGAFYANSNPSYLFDGLIDDVRIYNRAINASEIQEIYNEVPPAASGIDASLSAITLDIGTLDPIFSATTFNYDVTLPYGTTSVELGATPTDENASNVSGTGTITITHGQTKSVDILVTAEDGSTQQTYTVNFTTEPNNDASLSAITLDIGTLDPTFSATTFSYDVTLPYGTTSVKLGGTTTDPNASEITGTGTITITNGETKSVDIVVTAEDGETQVTYQINFTTDKIRWNGTSWNNSTGPSETEDAIIAGDFIGGLTSANLEIKAGATVTVTGTLDIHGDLINEGEIIVESGSTLLTYAGNQVTGSITIRRNTRYGDGKYSFVGSPVQQSAAITGQTLGPIVYQYNEATAFGSDGLARWQDASDSELMPGKGYAQANQKIVEFIGVPNSGAITYTGTYTSDTDDANEGWNLVSNPYAAAINTSSFLTENVNNTTGALYLWDDNGSDTGRGSNDDYITVNASGATDNNPANGNNSGRYNFHVGSAQGFFVKLDETSNKQVVFTESMRVTGNNADDHFFRIAEDIQRVRINLVNEDGLFKQTLIAWNNEVDDEQISKLYDAQIFNQNADNAIYSYKNGIPLAIQTITDQKVSMDLGFNVAEAGVYSLQADISECQREVYLIDHQTEEIIDLTNQEYVFSALQGKINDRFELTFEKQSILSTGVTGEWEVYVSDHQVHFIPAEGAIPQNFRIFSLDGKLVFEELINQKSAVYLNVPEGVYLIAYGEQSQKILLH